MTDTIPRDYVSPAQLRLLGHLVDLTAETGLPPTVAELAKRNGTYRHDVEMKLRRLCRLGLVRWEPGRGRTLTATCRFIPMEPR